MPQQISHRKYWKIWSLWLLPAMLFLFLLWSVSGLSHYKDISENLLINLPLSQTVRGGQPEPENTMAKLGAEGILMVQAEGDFQGRHVYRIRRPNPESAVRLTAEYSAIGLGHGRADMRIAFSDEDDNVLSGWAPGIIFGEQDWQALDMIFVPQSRTVFLELIIQNYTDSGEYRVKDLSLYEVEKSFYGRYGIWFCLLFLLLLLIWYGFYMGLLKSPSGAFLVLVVIGIFTATLMPQAPANLIADILSSVEEQVEVAAPVISDVPLNESTEETLADPSEITSSRVFLISLINSEAWSHVFRNLKIKASFIAHLSLFFVLGIVLSAHIFLKAPSKKSSYAYSFLALILLGALAEWVQLVSENRKAGFGDMWLNYTGALAGLTLFLIFQSIRSFFAKHSIGNRLSADKNK